jgi:hypothetical protein
MHKKRNLAIVIIVSAAASVFALQNVFAPSPAELPASTFTLTSTATITILPTYEGCGFMWAYHDDPELSAKLDKAVRDLDPFARAHAQLFGEDCVYADGHSTFSAMETDFYVRFSAEDLSTEEDFGSWIKQVMDFIIKLPEDEVQGRKGFVEFSFNKNEDEHLIVRVGISDYLNNAADPDPLEVFQQFYTPLPPPVTSGPITPTATP